MKKKTLQNAKVTKRSHVYRGHGSICNIAILNSFNSELQLKDNESAIRSKLKDLLTEPKEFKLVTTSVLDF